MRSSSAVRKRDVNLRHYEDSSILRESHDVSFTDEVKVCT
jgi:hypothetical protein